MDSGKAYLTQANSCMFYNLLAKQGGRELELHTTRVHDPANRVLFLPLMNIIPLTISSGLAYRSAIQDGLPGTTRT